MTHLPKDIQAAVDLINQIPAVATLLEVVCRTTGMGFAAVARVTEDRWVACSVRDEIQFGLVPGGELKLETTICHEIRQNNQLVVIDHVAEDERYATHHTPLMYGFQSYISVPIMLKNGSFFGTLCAIDPRPARLNNTETLGMFRLFAELIAFHLNAVDQLTLTQTKLLEEKQTAELREQFIAILGHDLRNPLSAVSNSAQLLLRLSAEEDVLHLANIIKNSSYRMSGLIENILDFARGRLGGGITLNRKIDEQPGRVLNQVIVELQSIWPQRLLETRFNFSEPVYLDENRIAQLFSNLLGNAITYGKSDEPVRVEATSKDGIFTLSVSNRCTPIPAATLDHIFEPFARGEAKAGQQGLGLGLYIASEIARAHGGTINATSTEAETRFTLEMPDRP